MVSQMITDAYRQRSGVVTSSLDADSGLDFIVDNWKYKKDGTRAYTKEILDKFLSSGVYVDGVPAAAIIVNWNGFLGMLYSGKEFRGKGYAKMCTLHLMKQLGLKGYHIASGVECNNKPPNRFHESLGFLKSHVCDDILF